MVQILEHNNKNKHINTLKIYQHSWISNMRFHNVVNGNLWMDWNILHWIGFLCVDYTSENTTLKKPLSFRQDNFSHHFHQLLGKKVVLLKWQVCSTYALRWRRSEGSRRTPKSFCVGLSQTASSMSCPHILISIITLRCCLFLPHLFPSLPIALL